MDLTSIKKIAGLIEQKKHRHHYQMQQLSEDVQSMFKIAGMSQLMDAYEYDDSDDEDEDEDDEDVTAAESEARLRNIKLPSVASTKKPESTKSTKSVETDNSDDDEDGVISKVHAGSASTEAKQRAEDRKGKFWDIHAKAAEKKETPIKEKPIKRDRVPGEEIKRGKPKQELSKSGLLRAYYTDHPESTTKEAWAYMQTKGIDFTPAGWNTLNAKARKEIVGLKRDKKKIEEAYVIAHPHMNSFILHENTELHRDQWVSESEISDLPPYMFETKAEARDFATRSCEYRNQSYVIKRIVFED
jgi:hypothetical protein